MPTAVPTANPSPTVAPGQTTTLSTASLLGSPGFVNTNDRTVYVLSDDTVSSIACTVASGCTGVWPPVSPPNGIALTTGFTAFARADLGGQMQLAYMNHPLYQYSGDSANGQTNGNGLVSFGGTWSVARP
jgi:predicted lipoprotein with Yx(FWY)xxD motif